MGRRRTTGAGKRSIKYARTAISYRHKQEVLAFMDAGNELDATIAKFYPQLDPTTNPNYDRTRRRNKQKQINKWTKQRTTITQVCAAGKGSHHNLRKRGEGTVLSRDAEESIAVWINSVRREGCPVSATMLRLKALEVANDCDISEDAFAALDRWWIGFLRRWRLSLRARTRHGQTTPEDTATAAAAFVSEFRRLIVEESITTVLNADQTGTFSDSIHESKHLLTVGTAVFFDYLPRQTISQTGQRTVWVRCSGKDKERATAMLLGDWRGTKHAPFIVFKTTKSKKPELRKENDEQHHGFGRHLWQEASRLQDESGCQIYGNPTAW